MISSAQIKQVKQALTTQKLSYQAKNKVLDQLRNGDIWFTSIEPACQSCEDGTVDFTKFKGKPSSQCRLCSKIIIQPVKQLPVLIPNGLILKFVGIQKLQKGINRKSIEITTKRNNIKKEIEKRFGEKTFSNQYFSSPNLPISMLSTIPNVTEQTRQAILYNRLHEQYLPLKIGNSLISGAGQGVFATQKLPKGRIVVSYIGQVVKTGEYWPPSNSLYGLGWFHDGKVPIFVVVEPVMKLNAGRYINSVEKQKCNCAIEKCLVNGQISLYIFTLREIEAQQELYYYYGEDYSMRSTDEKSAFDPSSKNIFDGIPHGSMSQALRVKLDAKQTKKTEKILKCSKYPTKKEISEVEQQKEIMEVQKIPEVEIQVIEDVEQFMDVQEFQEVQKIPLVEIQAIEDVERFMDIQEFQEVHKIPEVKIQAIEDVRRFTDDQKIEKTHELVLQKTQLSDHQKQLLYYSFINYMGREYDKEQENVCQLYGRHPTILCRIELMWKEMTNVQFVAIWNSFAVSGQILPMLPVRRFVKELNKDQLNLLYRFFCKRAYNKFTHQFPRMRQQQIITKVLKEWGLVSRLQVSYYNFYFSQRQDQMQEEQTYFYTQNQDDDGNRQIVAVAKESVIDVVKSEGMSNSNNDYLRKTKEKLYKKYFIKKQQKPIKHGMDFEYLKYDIFSQRFKQKQRHISMKKAQKRRKTKNERIEALKAKKCLQKSALGNVSEDESSQQEKSIQIQSPIKMSKDAMISHENIQQNDQVKAKLTKTQTGISYRKFQQRRYPQIMRLKNIKQTRIIGMIIRQWQQMTEQKRMIQFEREVMVVQEEQLDAEIIPTVLPAISRSKLNSFNQFFDQKRCRVFIEDSSEQKNCPQPIESSDLRQPSGVVLYLHDSDDSKAIIGSDSISKASNCEQDTAIELINRFYSRKLVGDVLKAEINTLRDNLFHFNTIALYGEVSSVKLGNGYVVQASNCRLCDTKISIVKKTIANHFSLYHLEFNKQIQLKKKQLKVSFKLIKSSSPQLKPFETIATYLTAQTAKKKLGQIYQQENKKSIIQYFYAVLTKRTNGSHHELYVCAQTIKYRQTQDQKSSLGKEFVRKLKETITEEPKIQQENIATFYGDMKLLNNCQLTVNRTFVGLSKTQRELLIEKMMIKQNYELRQFWLRDCHCKQRYLDHCKLFQVPSVRLELKVKNPYPYFNNQEAFNLIKKNSLYMFNLNSCVRYFCDQALQEKSIQKRMTELMTMTIQPVCDYVHTLNLMNYEKVLQDTFKELIANHQRQLDDNAMKNGVGVPYTQRSFIPSGISFPNENFVDFANQIKFFEFLLEQMKSYLVSQHHGKFCDMFDQFYRGKNLNRRLTQDVEDYRRMHYSQLMRKKNAAAQLETQLDAQQEGKIAQLQILGRKKFHQGHNPFEGLRGKYAALKKSRSQFIYKIDFWNRDILYVKGRVSHDETMLQKDKMIPQEDSS